MAIITFWNDNTGKIGQTHSALAIATHMSIEHNYKILLISTRKNDQVIAQAFGTNERVKTIKLLTNTDVSMDLESGIEGMSKMVEAKRLTPEIVQNYTKIILKKRLEILAGPKTREDSNYENLYADCKDIIGIASRYYDIVFVDLNNGFKSNITKEILKISTIVILNMEQKPSELAKVKKLKEKIFTKNNVLLLLNRYDRKSKYSTKNISRELGEKNEILSVPYCNLFSESVEEGTTAEFFLNSKIRKLDDIEDRTAFFINELNRAIEAIEYKKQEIQIMGR